MVNDKMKGLLRGEKLSWKEPWRARNIIDVGLWATSLNINTFATKRKRRAINPGYTD
jgi:hypothetical protein